MVAELDNHRIQVLSPSGEKIRSFGNQGSAKGQFHSSIGVAVDGEGNILVADSKNHRIQKFTAEGQFLTAVGTKGSGPLQFTNPSDIAISGKVYVVDYQIQLHHREKTEPVRKPATHQSQRTTHQRKSVQCSSETASGEAWNSNPNYC